MATLLESTMELYHNNMSVCAQKVRIVIAEKGLSPIEHTSTSVRATLTRPSTFT